MFKSFYLRFLKIYSLMNLNSKNQTILIKLKTGLFIIFSLFVFISCSKTKITYNFADIVIINWFESYFDIRDKQRLDLKKKSGNSSIGIVNQNYQK
jgi:hypothetical protein